MHLFRKHHHLVGGTLLIAGTSIGVGMLGLPVVTSAGGFFPSLAIYAICWIFMVATALLILEACLWLPKESNLISVSRELLGKKGAIACWILYLFLFYCLMTAHLAAGGGAVSMLSAKTLPDWLSTIIYTAIFAPVVYLGTRAVDRLNIGLMLGVFVTYFCFIAAAASHLRLDFLVRSDWSKIWVSLPVVLTAFGFQNLIPTLVTYMERDHRKIRLAIWIGTSIPFVLYVVWQLLVLGIAPLEGPSGLQAALEMGQSAIPPLQAALQSETLAVVATVFSLFAMTTSFVGISIAFFDFWADGLKWKKKGIRKTALLALVIGIPLLFVLLDPNIFLKALGLAGGIGMVLLLAVLPIFFVWSGRYIHRHTPLHPFVPGGKKMLGVLLAFCILILALQLFI